MFHGRRPRNDLIKEVRYMFWRKMRSVSRARCWLVFSSVLCVLYVVISMLSFMWNKPCTPTSDHLPRYQTFPEKFNDRGNNVAIIVSYRNRETHLKIFLTYMKTFLKRQNSVARIYIVEQYGRGVFNRAKLFNVGYHEAKKDGPYDCFIFHDVDLLPEDNRLRYECRDQPVHMSSLVDKFKYRLPYPTIFGGVVALKEWHLKTVNGFANRYWGWGAEDDDMYKRIHFMNFTIMRPAAGSGRYTMLQGAGKHTKGKVNYDRDQLLETAVEEMTIDGLNSTDYVLLSKEDRGEYSWVSVDLNVPNDTLLVHRPIPIRGTTICQRTQERRRTAIRSVCENHKYDIKTRLPTQQFYEWRREQSNLLVLEKERAIYCMIPSVASGEWKMKLLSHMGVFEEKYYNDTDFFEPFAAIEETLGKHGIQQLNSFNDSHADLMMRNFTKFAFFMNPYSRLANAFAMLNQSDNRLGLLMDIGEKPPITFGHFLTYLKSEDPDTADIYWRRYINYCNPCEMGYDFIGLVETLDTDAKCLLSHLNMSPWFPKAGLTPFYFLEDMAVDLFKSVNKDALAVVRSLYGIEAAMFGYTEPERTMELHLLAREMREKKTLGLK